MQLPLSKLPKSFESGLARWQSARVSSAETQRLLLDELRIAADESTNVYSVDLRPDGVDKFGFIVAQSAFDLGMEISPVDILGSDPDKRYLASDVFPNYLHVRHTGEVNTARMTSNMSGTLAHYDRLILPISLSRSNQPEFAISLSKLRLRVNPGDASGKELSTKELAVLNAAAQGLTAKEAAREMNSSPRTVETQLESAKRKLGASTTAHAVAIFLLMSNF